MKLIIAIALGLAPAIQASAGEGCSPPPDTIKNEAQKIADETQFKANTHAGACQRGLTGTSKPDIDRANICIADIQGMTANGRAQLTKTEEKCKFIRCRDPQGKEDEALTREEQLNCTLFVQARSFGLDNAMTQQASTYLGNETTSQALASGAGENATVSSGMDGKTAAILGGVGVVAVGGIAAYLITSGGKDNNNPPAAPAPPCMGPNAYKNSVCNEVLSNLCATNPAHGKCAKFNQRYCAVGVNSTTHTVTNSTNGTGEGIGSGYCRFVLVSGYCKVSGRSACPVCAQAAAQTSPQCQADPTKCIGENSADNNQSQACPPVPGLTDTTVVNSGTPVPVTGLDPGVPTPAPSTRSGAAVNGATTATATGLQPDIPGRFGPSLFVMDSQAVKSRCAQGRLNNCSASR